MSGKLTFKLCQLTIADQGSDLKTPFLVEITNLGFLISKLNPLRIIGKNVPHSAIIKLGELLRNNSVSKTGGARGVVDGAASQNKVRFKDCYLTIAEQVSDLNALMGEIIDLGFLIAKFSPLEITGTNISRATLRKLGKVLSKHCEHMSGAASGFVDKCDSQKDLAASVKRPSPTAKPTPKPTPQLNAGQLNLDERLSKGSAGSRAFDESQMRPQFYAGPKTRLKVYVRKLDITKLDADAIVSSADRRLHHSCGVAQAIASAAGPSLVNECESYRRTPQRLDVTDVVVSTGGLLKAKYVLHAVGPKFEACTDKKLSADLRRTVVRCLVEASRLKCESVALPSICSVAVILTKEQIAQCYMEAVKSFDDFADKLGVVPVKEVWFVDINEIMVDAIQKRCISEWDRPVDTAVSREDFKFAQEHLLAKINGRPGSAAAQDKYQQSLPQGTRQRGQSHQTASQADVAKTTGATSPSVATHTKGATSPSDGTHTKGIISPPAASHTKGAISPPVATHTKGAISPPVATHTKGVISPSIATHTKGIISPPAASHTKGAISPPVATHTKGVISPSIATHTKGITSPPAASHTKGAISPPVATHTKGAISPPVATHTKGVISPSVATHTKGFQDEKETSTYKSPPKPLEKHTPGGMDKTEGSYIPATQQAKGICPGNQASGQYIPIVVQGNTSRTTGSDVDYLSYSASQHDIGQFKDHPWAQVFNSQPFSRDLENTAPGNFERDNLPNVERGNLPNVERGNLPDVQRGNLPNDQRRGLPDVDMSCFLSRMDVSGYTGKGTIEITYKIGGGRTPSSPGKSSPSSERTAYLPATDEGFEALRLLRIAFLRRLIFTMDASNPAGIAWNIQHKTSLTNSPHGYPDPTYLTRLMQELKDNGVRLKSMSEEEENLSLEFVERVMKTKITRH